jgi:hypothetical protein
MSGMYLHMGWRLIGPESWANLDGSWNTKDDARAAASDVPRPRGRARLQWAYADSDAA